MVGPLHVIVGTPFVTRKNALDDSTPQSPSVGAGVGDVGATEAVGAEDAVGAAELGATVGDAVGADVVCEVWHTITFLIIVWWAKHIARCHTFMGRARWEHDCEQEQENAAIMAFRQFLLSLLCNARCNASAQKRQSIRGQHLTNAQSVQPSCTTEKSDRHEIVVPATTGRPSSSDTPVKTVVDPLIVK